MGFFFVLLGLTGWLPNPVIGAEGFFLTDGILNCLLILFGCSLFPFTTRGEGTAATGLYFVAMAALAVALFGYVQLSDYPSSGPVRLFNMVTCNHEDVWLLAGMGVVLIACGMMNTSSRQVIRD